jgi:replicative DNA helicase
MSELHNADLELAVLGGLLIEPTLCADVAAVMGEDSIYSQRTRQAYATLQAMSRESAQADFLAVADKLETLSPTGDWTRWLAEVMRNTPSAANVKSYAVRVEEYATLRKLDAAGRAVCQSCHDPDLSISEKIGRAQQKTGACLVQVSQRQEVFGQGGLSQFPSSPRAVAGRGLRGQRLRE